MESAGGSEERDWAFLPDASESFMLAALRVSGPAALDPAIDIAGTRDELLGRELMLIAFGSRRDDPGIRDLVAQLTSDPRSKQARKEFAHEVFQAFRSDPAKAERAAAAIVAFHRWRAGEGDVQALADLGDFLYFDEPETARTAYQDAIAAGHEHALIGLGNLLRRMLDEDGAFEAFQQAARSSSRDLRAEAMLEIAWFYLSHRDTTAGVSVLQDVISTGHPEWAPAAMIALADVLVRDDDRQAAESLYRQAIQAGNAEHSAHARWLLGELLADTGDTAGARACWLAVIETGQSAWSGPAITSLVNVLAQQQDVQGLRAVYASAAQAGLDDSPYALTQLGQVLESRGEIAGAHAAWQQAIDAGCEEPDYWRERISPPPPPRPDRRPYPPDLPAEFNPRNMISTALHVLERGLPPLPAQLTPDMAIPLAYWTARQHALVLVLTFTRWEGQQDSTATACVLTFTRHGDTWTPPQHFHGHSWSHDPIARPHSLRDLGGRPMVSGSGTTTMMHGRVTPDARELSLIQDGHEDTRPLDSHFGAWIVCTDDTTPFEVEARDAEGNPIARLSNWMAHTPRSR
jgi:tetratricopeptide (TPR) repeat protein